jgi:hypothetical protein
MYNFKKRDIISELEAAQDAAYEFTIAAVQYSHFPGEVDEQELIRRIDRVARRINSYFVANDDGSVSPGEAALEAARRKLRSLRHRGRMLAEAGHDVNAAWLDESDQTATIHALAVNEVVKWRLAELIYQRAILPNPRKIQWLAAAIVDGGDAAAILEANRGIFD